MPLPELIEILPIAHPLQTTVTVPGSKSITNRALILAALANGRTELRGALWSEDTQVMVECLHQLGFEVDVQPDPEEFCNRVITVQGLGGHIPKGGSAEAPLELFVGNAGTAARFLSAFVCLGTGVYRLSGVPRMHERPQAALFTALRQLGYRIEAPKDKLPAILHGAGPRKPGHCQVSIAESSQFASALLLSAGTAGWTVEVESSSGDAEEAPYITMTERLIQAFPNAGGVFQIEPDASSGSYFWAAGWLLASKSGSAPFPPSRPWPIEVRNWPTSGWQIDAEFPKFLPLHPTISRESHLGDSIMTAIVLAADLDAARRIAAVHPPALNSPVNRFTDLGRLRVQECERVAALRTELLKCGARITETGDTLEIEPVTLHGATIDTYQDHRMAMCFATLGLKIGGMKLRNPLCVRKTFPNFFQKLAAPPPHGLGVSILNAANGNRLSLDDLFAG
jgi:3-phosphoshikimate 1-carboxyvinyltransferase